MSPQHIGSRGQACCEPLPVHSSYSRELASLISVALRLGNPGLDVGAHPHSFEGVSGLGFARMPSVPAWSSLFCEGFPDLTGSLQRQHLPTFLLSQLRTSPRHPSHSVAIIHFLFSPPLVRFCRDKEVIRSLQIFRKGFITKDWLV